MAQEDLIRLWLGFLARPYYNISQTKKPRAAKIWEILKLWSFVVVISFLFGLLAVKDLAAAGYDVVQNSFMSGFLAEPWYVIVFFAFFWAPVVEELTFRLGLKYSPYKLGLSLALLIMTLIDSGHFLGQKIYSSFLIKIFSYSKIGGLIAYFGFFIVVGFVLGQVLKKKLDSKKMEAFYSRHFTFLFYLSAFLFAIFHIFNYFSLESVWFLAFLLIVPQFILGLMLGYIRLRYGFSWAVISHFIHNGLITAPVIVFNFLPSDLIKAIQEGNTARIEQMSGRETALISLIFLLAVFVVSLICFFFIKIIYDFYKTPKKTN